MFGYLIKVLQATGFLLISENFIQVGKLSNRNNLLQMFMLITYGFQVGDAN